MCFKYKSSFVSSDGSTDIYYTVWEPDSKPCAVLQICHGMVEFIERYDEFARFLTDRNIAVIGHDHIGHGDSVNSTDDWGFFHEERGNEILIEDINTMMKVAKSKWSVDNYFLMGHSMGSFLVRQYMFTYPKNDLSGCIIMGTGYKFEPLIYIAKIASYIEGCVRGFKKPSNFVTKIFVKENIKMFPNARSVNDWLTKDRDIVREYNSNPKTSFRFSNRAYYDLFRGMLTIYKRKNTSKLNKNIPYLLVSGDCDPVGDFGEGVKKVYKEYKSLGILDVSIKLFRDDRHEILNEIDRNDVYKYIYEWIEQRIKY